MIDDLRHAIQWRSNASPTYRAMVVTKQARTIIQSRRPELNGCTIGHMTVWLVEVLLRTMICLFACALNLTESWAFTEHGDDMSFHGYSTCSLRNGA